jgi:hypothetical protein
MEAQLPFPFSNRDMVFKRYKDISEDTIVSWSQSIERPDFPVKKNTVRMTLRAAGLLFQSDPKNPGCFKFTYYFNADLQQTYLPLWMLNAAAADYLGLMKRFRKYVELHYPPSNK